MTDMRTLPEEYVSQELWLCKSELFSYLCKLLKQVSFDLDDPEEDGQGSDAAIKLRIEYARLRYTPWHGDAQLFSHPLLSDKEKVGRLYGEEARKLLNRVEELHANWRSGNSILIDEFRRQIINAISEFGVDRIRIACRSREIANFQKLLNDDVELTDTQFITGLKEYRVAQPFDVLFRIGSFRMEGMQKIAPPILNAPKYKKLIRFCWDRTSDEIELAQDPITSDINYLQLMPVTTRTVSDSTHVEEYSDTDTSSHDDEFLNDAENYSSKGSSHIKCIRILLSENKAALFRKGHRQLVFRNHSDSPEILQLTAKEIRNGDFWIDQSIEVDLGKEEINPEDYPMAKIWKSDLHRQLRRLPGAVTLKMLLAGIALQDRYKAAENWSTFDRYRINAPQRKSHFIALIESVLRQEIWDGYDLKDPHLSIAENAWAELSNYKSRSIENGQLSHRIVADQLYSELRKCMASYIDILSANTDFYEFTMPEDTGLIGHVVFRRVSNIDRGFYAPEEMLSKLIDKEQTEQYRAIQNKEYKSTCV
tara:strand:- start:12 stop:1619 length:1608 start_codon:yes stop_codon:yes gene_type:complete